MATSTVTKNTGHKTKVERVQDIEEEEESHVDVETVSSDDDDDDEGAEEERTSTVQPAKPTSRTINKKERAARKELSKACAMKPLPHVKRVTFKRHNGPIFAIAQPEVFLDTISGHYIVYGQPVVETGSLPGMSAVAAQRAAEGVTGLAPSESSLAIHDDDDDDDDDNAADEGSATAKTDAADAMEDADANGLDEKDISIVMEQAHVSRAKAIKALRANDNDIVNTIMELTM